MSPKDGTSRPIGYLEQKCPDYRRIAELCRMSDLENHWANGGPVCRLLETRIAELTSLHPDRAVVACSSGTAAINVLAGLHALKQARPLRWAVSAYSFFCSFIGPFADSLIIDCDSAGMLDLDTLSRIPANSYDGVCVTNLFGLYPDIGRYQSFCRELKKPLIVDNAQGLFRFDRSRADTPDEIISFHHTKTWGFGEGGCAIVSREDEQAARAIINFGVSLERRAAPFVFNGKMSDVSAAFIVDRLERIPEWAQLYGKQYRRIADLVEQTGLAFSQLAAPAAPPSGMGQVPLVALRAVEADRLQNDHFVMRKYYRPPEGPGLAAARKLYGRIVNIPCHPGMAVVSDAIIFDVLSRLTSP